MNKKAAIMEAALGMFADKGFEPVSIRDIASAVGIKESSVYYHFKSKQDIMDTLLAEFEQRSAQMMAPLEEAVSAVIKVDPRTFYFIAACYLQDYLLDDFVRAFLRVLVIEQGHDERLRGVYRKWLYRLPMEYYGEIFGGMKRAGFLKRCDIEYMTNSFYAPVILCFQKYLMYDGAGEEELEGFREAVHQHFIFFLDEFSTVRRIPV